MTELFYTVDSELGIVEAQCIGETIIQSGAGALTRGIRIVSVN